ncbi:hypothetical protein [Mycobacterium triplex]|uniref:Carotenoid biosynthesis protein n=1 Tax=Mycobacterium triplex TaxID=47839 RepID=A0A024JZL3_9MYCO|nr:hypothetical protein [Mycobacterium triplex]CDO89111.1 hypothetical protein BN973_03482 [Mycobacterium triplex]
MTNALDKTVVASCVVFVALSGWAAVGPGGLGLPLAAQVGVGAALVVLLLGHTWKHLGAPLFAAFFGTAAIIEWAFEQANISFGGFIWGDIRYGDIGLFQAHLGDVAIAVPVLMAVLLWPTYVMINLLLDGRVVVSPRSMTWWQTLWHCALYGFVHSWLMLVFNGECERFGLYRWVGKSLNRPAADMFLGDPTAPRGWAIYVFVTMVVFTFVMVPLLGTAALARADERALQVSDGAPIVLFGTMGVTVHANAPNQTVGNVALWTVGFFAVLVSYRFVAILRDQRQPAAVIGTPPSSAHNSVRTAPT